VIPEEFQRGLIYTVDPRVLDPLTTGAEYRIVASTRFLIAKDAAFTDYESLYRRARCLVDRRREELISDGPESRVHVWIVSHGWFRMDIGRGALVGAVVTLGATSAAETADVPRGQDEPTPDALQSPHVAQLSAAGGAGKPWYDEFYNDFDMRSDRTQPSKLTVSYGEYVPSPADVDVDGVVARAEARARSYLEVVGAADELLRIARRDWNCLETGKAAKPFLAHVDLLFSDLSK
jgi:hypothetical protein